MATLSAAKRQVLERWLVTATELWALQDELRQQLDPDLRPLKPTADRLHRVAAVLESGVDASDCAEVLRKYAADGDAQWFNGETNWRPANFDRALGMVGAKASRAGPAVPSIADIWAEADRLEAQGR